MELAQLVLSLAAQLHHLDSTKFVRKTELPHVEAAWNCLKGHINTFNPQAIAMWIVTDPL